MATLVITPTPHLAARSLGRADTTLRLSRAVTSPTPRSRGAAAESGRRAAYLRRRVAVLVVVSSIVVGVLVAAAPVLHADPVDPTVGSSVHVVAAGDTVWSLAASLDPSADPRGVVDAILTLNARAGQPLDPAALQVGQRVLLPGT